MSMSPGQPHPNNVVREFLRSNSDASHLFFAKQVVPLLGETDVEIDRNITDLAQRLREDGRSRAIIAECLMRIFRRYFH